MTTLVRRYRFGGRIARTLAVARVEILHLIHDRTTISLILLVPAIQIVLFGCAVNLDPRHVPIAIAGDHGGRADQVRRVIGETGYFMIVADGLESGAAERMVAQGKALVGIELPPRENSDRGAPAEEPKVVVDATDPAAVRPALAALENAYWRHAAQLYAIGPVPSVSVEWLYNPEGRTAWTIVPGLAGVVVMISMLMLGALTLVRERERGSWETLLAHAPWTRSMRWPANSRPDVIIGTVQAAVVICIARLPFSLPGEAGNLWALLIAVPLYSCRPSVILGVQRLLGSGRGANLQAIQGAVFFYLPSMLLSGLHVSISGNAGLGTEDIGEMLPLTHFLCGRRVGCSSKAQAPHWWHPRWTPVAMFTLVAAALVLAAYRQRID